MYLVIDCKDVRAIPRIAEIINQFGSHRVVFHSWVDTLLFKPYPPEITIEPHWPYEDLPVSVVKDLHHQTGVTTICSARTYPHRLATEVDEITQHMISTVGSFATAINWNLPGGQAPPMAAMNTLLAHGIRTFINIDVVPSAFRPAKYIGMTDNIALSSRP
ncbi:hypothetical protein IPG36_07980 [bacterium]|nr:MAG: hypothetical protein IPG36_07980 [bacterium]